MYYLTIIFIFVFYGLLNAKSLPVESPLSSEMFKSVIQMGVDGSGSGLIATTMTYYIKQSIWNNWGMANKHICTYSWYYVCV